jgi:hypothetical protein
VCRRSPGPHVDGHPDIRLIGKARKETIKPRRRLISLVTRPRGMGIPDRQRVRFLTDVHQDADPIRSGTSGTTPQRYLGLRSTCPSNLIDYILRDPNA